MRAPRLLGLVTVFTFLPMSLSAQQATSTSSLPATSDPQAVALIEKSLAALTGGLAVTNVTLTGTARRIAGSDDETGTATLTATSAGDSKVTLNLPSGVRSEIRNHAGEPLPDSLPPGVSLPEASTQTQPVGAWSGPDGTLHGMASHNVMTDAAWFFPALTLANIASQNYVLSYIGQETFSGGQALLHVSASRPLVMPSGVAGSAVPAPPIAPLMEHLSRMDLYLDATSALPVALAFTVHPDGNALIDIPVQVQFSNYQSTSGVQVPLHVQKFLNNGLVLDLQFNNASLNSGLSASSFQLQ